MSEFPPVHDEATPTPPWVPVLGAAILSVLVLASVVRTSVREAFGGRYDGAAPVAGADPAPRPVDAPR